MLDPVVKEPRAPFPYFGGKRNAAQDVWDTLGDVGHYVEPFCGSCAILLARPRTHRGTVETVNDADGMLVNAWRSMRDDPDGVAKVCADPVMEIELHARLAFVKERMTPDFTAWMEGGPDHHDTRLAGYWIYATCASIGTCWNDDGPWRVVGGKLVKTREIWGGGRGIARELPHLSTAGSGLLGSCRTFLADGASCARESAFRRNRARTTALGRRGAGHQPGGPCARAECNRIAGGGIRGWMGTRDRERRIRAYLRALASRLSGVRICCGDWRRVVASKSVLYAGQPTAGIFLDPPYSVSPDLYAEGKDVSADVREWCKGAPKDAKIVLCGFANDHDDLLALGWRKIRGRAGGSGYGKVSAGERERLWLSPACIREKSLFDFSGGMGVADADTETQKR